MIELTLPHPISVNDYWVDFLLPSKKRPGKQQIMRAPSSEASRYKKDCGWIAKAAGFRQPTEKPISIRLVLHPKAFKKDGSKNGSRLDLGNCWKVAEDALQGIVYVNDRQIEYIELKLGPRSREGALVVQIEELEIPQTELFPEPMELQIGSARVIPKQPSGANPF